jgi:hypothetical protein
MNVDPEAGKIWNGPELKGEGEIGEYPRLLLLCINTENKSSQNLEILPTSAYIRVSEKDNRID